MEDGRKGGRPEIHPCVLHDMGPLGPLPKKWKPLTLPERAHAKTVTRADFKPEESVKKKVTRVTISLRTGGQGHPTPIWTPHIPQPHTSI